MPAAPAVRDTQALLTEVAPVCLVLRAGAADGLLLPVGASTSNPTGWTRSIGSGREAE
jgi:hypothetical protein